MAMKPRVCVVTAGHLSTCPRMLKAADALHAAGYRVRVVSTNHTPWASAADRDVMSRRARTQSTWTWQPIDYSRATARARQLLTGVRFRLAQATARAAGPARVPIGIAIRAYSRVHDELVAAVASEPVDFVYGGTTGALAAVAASAARLGVPYGIDLEDLHSGEQGGSGSGLVHALAERIERLALERAAFATASSPMIADAYLRKYGRRPIAIHNTFSIAFRGESADAPSPLRLYWFSQTLGAGRGLDEVVRALGRIGGPAELHLRARPIPSYLAALRQLQRDAAPAVTLVHHEPAPPDDMVPLAQGYDASLSCEQPDVPNKQLCLGNKIFTSLAAGTPVIVSRTAAQTELARDLGGAAFAYDCGDVDGLSEILRRLASDVEARRHAADRARAAAQRRWHWEHDADRGALLGAVGDAIG
jgi:glycosyltransferase involved in cell wall biosynthesis